MLAGGDLGFFVGGSNEGAAGESICAAGQTSRTLMDGQDGLIGEKVLGESGDFKMMFEIAGHIFEFETVQIRSSYDAGGQGLGGLVHELVKEVVLAGQDHRQDRFGIEVELGEGLEFGEDFESHQVGLVDDQDGGHFLESDVEEDVADGFGEAGDGDQAAVVIEGHSDLAIDFDGGACGGDDGDEAILGWVEPRGGVTKGGGFAGAHLAGNDGDGGQMNGIEEAFGGGSQTRGLIEAVGRDVFSERFFSEAEVGFIVGHRRRPGQKVFRSS